MFGGSGKPFVFVSSHYEEGWNTMKLKSPEWQTFSMQKKGGPTFDLFLFLSRLFVVNVSISQLKSLSKMVMYAAFSSHLSILLHMCRPF